MGSTSSSGRSRCQASTSRSTSAAATRASLGRTPCVKTLDVEIVPMQRGFYLDVKKDVRHSGLLTSRYISGGVDRVHHCYLEPLDLPGVRRRAWSPLLRPDPAHRVRPTATRGRSRLWAGPAHRDPCRALAGRRRGRTRLVARHDRGGTAACDRSSALRGCGSEAVGSEGV